MNYFHHTQQLLFQQHCQKVIPWDTLGCGPTPGCPRLWTSPRWSWTFCTCILRISGPRAFIWHLNLEPTVKTDEVSPFFFLLTQTRNAARCSLREHLSYIIIQKTDPVTISIICSLYSFNNNLEWLFWSYQPTFVSTKLPISHSLGHTGVWSYSWMSEALDFTQMVMDIRKQLKITIFIIPNNFCFNNIAKKSFPGTHQGLALLLGVRSSALHPDGHGDLETN